MTATVLPAVTLEELLGDLTHTSALLEIAIVLGCLGAAWGAVRLIQGRPRHRVRSFSADASLTGCCFPPWPWRWPMPPGAC